MQTRQLALLFIDPEAGHLEITFDARSGQATRLRSTRRQINTTAAETAESVVETSLEQLRQAACQRFIAATQTDGQQTSDATLEADVTLEGEQIGYQMMDGKAVPVYRALVKSARSQLSRPQLTIIPLGNN